MKSPLPKNNVDSKCGIRIIKDPTKKKNYFKI